MSDCDGIRGRTFVFLTALVTLSGAGGYAQTREGAIEVGAESGACLALATGGRESFGAILLVVEPHIDYYISEEVSAGVTGFFYRSFESDLSRPLLTFGGAYGQANFHFSPGRRFSPYAGVRVGVFTTDLESLFAFGAQTGLKYFVGRQVTINGQLDFSLSSRSGSTIVLFCLGLGMSYHF